MQSKIITFFCLAFALTIFSCKKKYPAEPEIEYLSVSKVFMAQNGQDSLQLKFSFVDGDGDIGNDTEDNVFVIDQRSNEVIATYRIPENQEIKDGAFRKGEVTLVVYSQCCVYPDSSSCYSNSNFPTDSMQYRVQIRDKAGNFSNFINSESIQLDCE